MKLKSIDGKVPYIMAAGKDFVKDEMSLAAAEQICSRETQTTSKLFPDFPICVDDKSLNLRRTQKKSKTYRSFWIGRTLVLIFHRLLDVQYRCS